MTSSETTKKNVKILSTLRDKPSSPCLLFVGGEAVFCPFSLSVKLLLAPSCLRVFFKKVFLCVKMGGGYYDRPPMGALCFVPFFENAKENYLTSPVSSSISKSLSGICLKDFKRVAMCIVWRRTKDNCSIMPCCLR